MGAGCAPDAWVSSADARDETRRTMAMIARGVNPRLIAQPFVSVAKRRGSALEFGLQGAVAREVFSLINLTLSVVGPGWVDAREPRGRSHDAARPTSATRHIALINGSDIERATIDRRTRRSRI
jgi:hypothetical protein